MSFGEEDRITLLCVHIHVYVVRRRRSEFGEQSGVKQQKETMS